MSASLNRSVWGYDPRWLRIEVLDECGDAVDRVYFEPNPAYEPAPPKKALEWPSILLQACRAWIL
jgi:hypothetical protein